MPAFSSHPEETTMERFTNKSPGALTMEQAIARHKKKHGRI